MLAGAGTLGVSSVGAYVVMTCNSNISELDEGDEGSQVDMRGDLIAKASDGSRVTLSGKKATASIQMRATYYNEITETETGSCISVSGLVTDVERRDGITRVRMEGGEVQ